MKTFLRHKSFWHYKHKRKIQKKSVYDSIVKINKLQKEVKELKEKKKCRDSILDLKTAIRQSVVEYNELKEKNIKNKLDLKELKDFLDSLKVNVEFADTDFTQK